MNILFFLLFAIFFINLTEWSSLSESHILKFRLIFTLLIWWVKLAFKNEYNLVHNIKHPNFIHMTRVDQVLKGWFVLYTLKGTVLKRRSLALLSERQFGYDILYLVLPPGLTKWCVFCCYQIIKGIYVCMPDFQYYFL